MWQSIVGFIFTFTLSLLVAPLAVKAQPPGKIYRIGYLSPGAQIATPFREALRQLGYVEGQNVVIEGRFAGQDLDRLPQLAAELVQLKVDVIVTVTSGAALAAQQATTTIPIVMAGADNPVELGLVASLARPGGNITGLSNVAREVAGKQSDTPGKAGGLMSGAASKAVGP